LGEIIRTVKKNLKMCQAHYPVLRSLARNSVNAEKTEYIYFRSHEQNLQQNCSIKIVNKSFENMTQSKYLEMILMNQQLFIQNARFNEGCNFVQWSNDACHSAPSVEVTASYSCTVTT
jgi:hypothetical protein